MKLTYATLFIIKWTLLVSAAMGLQVLRAQDAFGAVPPEDSIRLTGSTLKPEDGVVQSDAIFVGKIVDLGIKETPVASAYSGPTYHHMKVNVTSALKNPLGNQVSAAMFISGVHREKYVSLGSSYIFFVKKNPREASDPYTVIKLLVATNANIAEVKALIAGEPISK